MVAVASSLWAQDKPVLTTRPEAPVQSADTIKVSAQLVVLSVVVHDRKGGMVNGLTKDDFVIKAGGRSIQDAKPDEIHPGRRLKSLRP